MKKKDQFSWNSLSVVKKYHSCSFAEKKKRDELQKRKEFPHLSEKKLTGKVFVTTHLRGMRPAPTSKKHTLMLREKLKH